MFSDSNLVSPEFQITNESIIYLTINTFYNLTKGAVHRHESDRRRIVR